MGKGTNTKKSKVNNLPKKRRYQYSSDDIDKAVHEVTKKKITVRTAAKMYHIPVTTIPDCLKQTCKHLGKRTILSIQEEKQFCDWIYRSCENGFHVTEDLLLDGIKLYLDAHNRNTILADNRPKKDWYNGFMSRHPDVAIRTSECLSKGCAKLTEKVIRNWFQKVGLIKSISIPIVLKQKLIFFLIFRLTIIWLLRIYLMY